MAILPLAYRKLIRLSGADTEALLQRLITPDFDDLALGSASYGALLTPQGKILMDFLVTRQDDGFLFDLDGAVADDFVKKMTLYRMRSDVVIEPLDWLVGVSLEPVSGGVKDPRSDALGWRVYTAGPLADADESLMNAYTDHRINAGIPKAGVDFAYGDAFPHDVNMDYLGALDFDKGCYVGQEVVSRMKHRGTARRRIVQIHADAPLPESGTAITADGKPVGTLGSVAGNKGLALVRIDRVAEAKKEGVPLVADGVVMEVRRPDYADFDIGKSDE